MRARASPQRSAAWGPSHVSSGRLMGVQYPASTPANLFHSKKWAAACLSGDCLGRRVQWCYIIKHSKIWYYNKERWRICFCSKGRRCVMIGNENGPRYSLLSKRGPFPDRTHLLPQCSACWRPPHRSIPLTGALPLQRAVSIHQGTQPRQIFRVPAAVIVLHSSARGTIRSGFICQTITVATLYVQINKRGAHSAAWTHPIILQLKTETQLRAAVRVPVAPSLLHGAVLSCGAGAWRG